MLEQEKIAAQANDLAKVIFEISYESESFFEGCEDSYFRTLDKGFMERIMENPTHRANILKILESNIFADITAYFEEFIMDDDCRYQVEETDYNWLIIEYIRTQYDNTWLPIDSEAATKEGWDLYSTIGSVGGQWQIQRNDSDGLLEDDKAAFKIVANGDEPHHLKVKALLKANNEDEYNRVMAYALKQRKPDEMFKDFVQLLENLKMDVDADFDGDTIDKEYYAKICKKYKYLHPDFEG